VSAAACEAVPAQAPAAASDRVIAIGASTGGTEALKVVLSRISPQCPPILVAQHMPAAFTRSFAQRLDSLCRITISEAADGDKLLDGHAYIAPGHSHLTLVRRGGLFFARLRDTPPVNRHRPSVDVLFESVAEAAGRRAAGAILTGMGKDGALGLLAMKRAGGRTIAQDEASCAVFGMPREAIAIGAVDEVAPLTEIAPRLLSWAAAGRELRV